MQFALRALRQAHTSRTTTRRECGLCRVRVTSAACVACMCADLIYKGTPDSEMQVSEPTNYFGGKYQALDLPSFNRPNSIYFTGFYVFKGSAVRCCSYSLVLPIAQRWAGGVLLAAFSRILALNCRAGHLAELLSTRAHALG